MNTGSEKTLKTVSRFHEAFERHRPDDLDDLIGEGCVLHNTTPAPDGACYAGRAACLGFWKGIASNAKLVFEAEDIWAGQERGIIQWRLRWGDGAANRVRGVNVLRVRDGKIVQAEGYVKA